MKKSNLFIIFYLFFVLVTFSHNAEAASLVLGVAGAALGGLFGPLGAQIGWMAGAFLGNLLFKKGTNTEGPRLQDLHVQTNTNGQPIPSIWGTVLCAGQIIWCPGFIEEKHEEKQGGKGGPSNTYTTYSYYVNCAIAICEGPIFGIRRIYANEHLEYDVSTGNEGGAGDLKKYIRIYKGGEDQLPDGLIQQYQKGETPAYRGISYIVFDRLPLEKYGNQIPSFKFEVIRTPDDVGVDSYGDKYSNYSYKGNNYANGQIEVNYANGYLYRFSLNNPNINEPMLVQKINPNTYQVEKSNLVPTPRNMTFPGGNSYQNYVAQVLSNGTLFYTAFGDGTAERNNDIVLYTINPNTLGLGKIYPVDECEKGIDNKWYGPFEEILNAGLYAFYNKFTPKNSDTTFYVTSGPSDGYYYTGKITSSGGTAKKIDLPQNFNIYYGWPCAGTKTGLVYFFTVDKTKTSDIYLSCSDGNHNILKISDSSFSNIPYIGGAYYDEVTANLFVLVRDDQYKNVRLLKIDIKNKTIIKTLELKFENTLYYSLNFGIDDINRKFIMSKSGYFAYDDNKNLVLIDFDSFVIDTKPIKLDRVHNAYLNPSLTPCYNSLSDHYIYSASYTDSPTTNKWAYIVYRGNRYDFGTYPLPDVVKEICSKTGVPIEKIDASDLNGIAVKGYVRATRTTARSLLELLSTLYNFDGVESCGKLKFIKRGKDSVANIDHNELGAMIYQIGNTSKDSIKTQRTQEMDLPRVANILYYDRDKDYTQNTQESKRVIETTENIYTLEAPAVLVPNEAKQIIDRIMYQTWTARDKYQFSTSMDYAYIEPTDVVKIINNNLVYTLRITKKDESQGVCKFEAEAEDQTVYNQNGQGDGGLKPDQNITVTSATTPYLIDCPIFDQSDNNSGLYCVFDKVDPKGYWKGAILYKSLNSTGTFNQIDGLGSFSYCGSTIDKLADWNGKNIIDYSDSVTVVLNNGSLESVSEEDLINGSNLAIIGDEVIQFKDVEVIDNNTYILSGLNRAKFGTEDKAINHTDGERFILFDFLNEKVMRINKNDSMFNVEKFYKAITYGKTLDSVPAIPFTNTGRGYKSYAVHNITHNINDLNDIFIEFNYSGRGQVKFDDTIPVDIDGDLNFEMDILDDKNNIIRTLNSKTNNFIYTHQMQIEDFNETVNKLNVVIYRLNNLIGRGLPKVYSI